MLDLSDQFGEVSAATLRSAWKRWIGPQRFHRKLAQMSRAGWAECRHTSPCLDRVFRLTTAGRLAAIGGREPQARWSRAWDGRWRLALFDIPEHVRGLRCQLRRKLRSLGFGYLQDSVWITPDPIAELQQVVEGTAVDVESLTFMEARPYASSTDRDLVTGAWNFKQINRNYERYLEILKAGPRCWDALRARRNWFEAEFRAWQRAFQSDPLLPNELLPDGYQGKHAWLARRKALHKILK